MHDLVLWPDETVAKYVCEYLFAFYWICFNLIANAVKPALIQPIAGNFNEAFHQPAMESSKADCTFDSKWCPTAK